MVTGDWIGAERFLLLLLGVGGRPVVLLLLHIEMTCVFGGNCEIPGRGDSVSNWTVAA